MRFTITIVALLATGYHVSAQRGGFREDAKSLIWQITGGWPWISTAIAVDFIAMQDVVSAGVGGIQIQNNITDLVANLGVNSVSDIEALLKSAALSGLKTSLVTASNKIHGTPSPFGAHVHEVFEALKELHHATKDSTQGFFMIIDTREAGAQLNDMLDLVWNFADNFNNTMVLADKPAEKAVPAASSLNRLIEIQGDIYELENDGELFPATHTRILGRSPQADKPYDYKDHHSSQYNDDHPQEFQRVHEYNRSEKKWESYWVNAKDVDTWVKENTSAKQYNRDDPRYMHFEVPDTRNALPIQAGHENDRKNGKEFPVAQSKIPEYRPKSSTGKKIGKTPGGSRKGSSAAKINKPPVSKSAPKSSSGTLDYVGQNQQGGSRKGSSPQEVKLSGDSRRGSNASQRAKSPAGSKKQSSSSQERKMSTGGSSMSDHSRQLNRGRPSHSGAAPYRLASPHAAPPSRERTASRGGESSRNGNGRRISRSTEEEGPAYMSGREPVQREESPEFVASYNTYADQSLWDRILTGRLGKVHGNPSKHNGRIEKHKLGARSLGDDMAKIVLGSSDSHPSDPTSPSSSTSPISRIHRRRSKFWSTLFGTRPKKQPDWQPVRQWNYGTRSWDYYMLDSDVTDNWAKEAGYGKYKEDRPRKINVIWDNRRSSSNRGEKGTRGKVCYFGKRC